MSWCPAAHAAGDRGRDFHKAVGSAHEASDILSPRMSEIARGAPAAESEEASLLARLRAGDEAAFALLVRRNAGRLLAVARRMLRSEEDARDALQDAFLQAFRA